MRAFAAGFRCLAISGTPPAVTQSSLLRPNRNFIRFKGGRLHENHETIGGAGAGIGGGVQAEPLKVAYSDWPGWVAWQVGIDKGWFKEEGVEVGFVGHLLLLKALEANGLTEADVTLVNVPTHETPKAFASGDVDAIVAWQPNSGQALKAVPGSKAIFTSKDAPGLIYDLLAVSPSSLSAREDDWKKVAKVWYRIVDYFNDPKTKADAIKIMAARVSLPPEEYTAFVEGTKILTLAEAKAAFKKGPGLTSIYGSNEVVEKFNIDNKVYEKPQAVADYIAPAITEGM